MAWKADLPVLGAGDEPGHAALADARPEKLCIGPIELAPCRHGPAEYDEHEHLASADARLTLISPNASRQAFKAG